MMKCTRIGPGWTERTFEIRPKARLFTVLSVVWCVISPTPVDLLMHHEVTWASLIGVFCWAIILAHPVFIVLALYFRLTEHQKTFKRRMLDPNLGLRR